MIAVYHERPDDPAAEKVRKALKLIYELPVGHKAWQAQPVLYKRYRDLLTAIFFNKCAYCEVSLINNQAPTMEHFRPKSAVHGPDDAPIVKDGVQHPGYRWLAYEWGNLLPSCNVCNSTYKRNYFPVRKAHVFERSDDDIDQLEGPLIYNPLNPPFPETKHFEIDLETGIIRGLTDIGRETVRTMGLNIRIKLVDARRTAIKETKRLIDEHYGHVIYGRPDAADTLLEMMAIEQGRPDFGFARRQTQRFIEGRVGLMRSKLVS